MKYVASYSKCKECKEYLERSCKPGIRIVQYQKKKRIYGEQINLKVFTNQ